MHVKALVSLTQGALQLVRRPHRLRAFVKQMCFETIKSSSHQHTHTHQLSHQPPTHNETHACMPQYFYSMLTSSPIVAEGCGACREPQTRAAAAANGARAQATEGAVNNAPSSRGPNFSPQSTRTLKLFPDFSQEKKSGARAQTKAMKLQLLFACAQLIRDICTKVNNDVLLRSHTSAYLITRK